MLMWWWKVAGILSRGDARKKQGDDYPARIYISFQTESSRLSWWEKLQVQAYEAIYGVEPPLQTIAYIWANKLAPGQWVDNPYTDRVKMLAVRSGSGQAGQWWQEQRNVLADYRQLFGEDPPPVASIAIMTDADNTGERMSSWYGEITAFASPGPSSSESSDQ